MRAIHGEHLKPVALDVTHPACDLGRRTVPRDAGGILVRRQAGLTRGESTDCTELDPRLPVSAPAGRAEDVADDRDADEGGTQHVQVDGEAEQGTSAWLRCWCHWSPPGNGRRCATGHSPTS